MCGAPQPTTHSFTHRARTATTASGKPVFTTLKYILTITTTAVGLSFTSTDASTDGVSQGPPEVTLANVSGHITLDPEPFDTTRVTMSASVQLGASREKVKTMARQGIGTAETMASRLGGVKKATATSFAPTLVHAMLDHLLSCIPNLHTRFARYDEIDDATFTKFERDVPSAPSILPHENALCDKSCAYDDDQVRNGDARRARASTQ